MKHKHEENHKIAFWVILFIVVFIMCCFLPDVKRKNNKEIITQYDIDPITQISHFRYDDNKKEMTTVSFGSPEEDMLVCIDARGNRNFKKVIVIEEK